MNPKRICYVERFGLVPYAQVWNYQRSLVQQRQADPNLADVLLLGEHPPVYTLGTGADVRFLKFEPTVREWEVYRVERGGEVTYHCPGQIVGYPILNLRHYQTDLHWYLRQLEEVMIRLLADYGLKGERVRGLTGVWIDGVKVGAIGIKVSRWMTMHGFSLNVCPDLTGFRYIVPCGISDRPVGSLVQFSPHLNLEQVYQDLVRTFASVFDVHPHFLNS